VSLSFVILDWQDKSIPASIHTGIPIFKRFIVDQDNPVKIKNKRLPKRKPLQKFILPDNGRVILTRYSPMKKSISLF
jgi:hypothetical protein